MLHKLCPSENSQIRIKIVSKMLSEWQFLLCEYIYITVGQAWYVCIVKFVLDKNNVTREVFSFMNICILP